MSGQKHRAFMLALWVLIVVPLAGCQPGEDFPFYLMEKREDNSEVLYIDSVQYRRDLDGGWDEAARYYSENDQYAWTPSEGIGEQIGVCSDETAQSVSLEIYEVAGDGEHIFLYTLPAHFYFGGIETRLWMQDGVTLGTPTTETVSSVTVVSEKGEETSAQVNDPAMTAALLEAFNGDRVQTRDGEDWVYGSLIMHHKDFPFLQYEIEYCCSLEKEKACCRNKDNEWYVLPAEWYKVISEHGFPNRGK